MFGLSQENLEKILQELEESSEDGYAGGDAVDVDIKSSSSEKLCSLIASNRYIRFNDQLEIDCMTELAARRANGDNLNFELKISEYYSQFIPIKMNFPDLMKIMKSVKGNL